MLFIGFTQSVCLEMLRRSKMLVAKQILMFLHAVGMQHSVVTYLRQDIYSVYNLPIYNPTGLFVMIRLAFYNGKGPV
jgi:hypothetical protein